VPARVAVPSPLSSSVNPVGSPLADSPGVGKPSLVVTGSERAVPTTAVRVFLTLTTATLSTVMTKFWVLEPSLRTLAVTVAP
jgi:hypothetical protein